MSIGETLHVVEFLITGEVLRKLDDRSFSLTTHGGIELWEVGTEGLVVQSRQMVADRQMGLKTSTAQGRHACARISDIDVQVRRCASGSCLQRLTPRAPVPAPVVPSSERSCYALRRLERVRFAFRRLPHPFVTL